MSSASEQSLGEVTRCVYIEFHEEMQSRPHCLPSQFRSVSKKNDMRQSLLQGKAVGLKRSHDFSVCGSALPGVPALLGGAFWIFT